jgi:hypothetical protein
MRDVSDDWLVYKRPSMLMLLTRLLPEALKGMSANCAKAAILEKPKNNSVLKNIGDLNIVIFLILKPCYSPI